MVLFSALPMLVGNVDGDTVFRVVEASRSAHFAGRLGDRIEDHLVVERDGERYEVAIGRRHTHISGKPPEFRVGDSVRVHGACSGHRFYVLPDEIELVRT